MGHAERDEEPLTREGRQRLAADALDDDCQQIVAGVAVGPGRSRWIVQRALARRDMQHVGHPVDAIAARPAAQRLDVAPVAQAAGVAEQLVERDRATVVGKFWDVLAHIVRQRKPAVLHEQQHRRGGELFGDRTGFEHRVRLVWNALLKVRGAISSNDRRLADAFDAHDTPRRCRREAREEAVEFRGRGARRGRLSRHQRDGQRQGERHSHCGLPDCPIRSRSCRYGVHWASQSARAWGFMWRASARAAVWPASIRRSLAGSTISTLGTPSSRSFRP